MSRPTEENPDPCYAKAVKEGMEVFVLIDQDYSAPSVICEWILRNIHSAPADKLREAFECALRMRMAPRRKNAD